MSLDIQDPLCRQNEENEKNQSTYHSSEMIDIEDRIIPSGRAVVFLVRIVHGHHLGKFMHETLVCTLGKSCLLVQNGK